MLKSLPFVPNLFDSILSVTVLQHNVEKSTFDSAVSEMLRITRIDGSIILLDILMILSGKYSVHFPTITHNYKEAFTCDGKLNFVDVQGVDLSLFLKPFNRIVKNQGKYRDSLEDSKPSSKYRLLASTFYFFASGCVPSFITFGLVFAKRLEKVLRAYNFRF